MPLYDRYYVVLEYESRVLPSEILFKRVLEEFKKKYEKILSEGRVIDRELEIEINKNTDNIERKFLLKIYATRKNEEFDPDRVVEFLPERSEELYDIFMKNLVYKKGFWKSTVSSFFYIK